MGITVAVGGPVPAWRAGSLGVFGGELVLYFKALYKDTKAVQDNFM